MCSVGCTSVVEATRSQCVVSWCSQMSWSSQRLGIAEGLGVLEGLGEIEVEGHFRSKWTSGGLGSTTSFTLLKRCDNASTTLPDEAEWTHPPKGVLKQPREVSRMYYRSARYIH